MGFHTVIQLQMRFHRLLMNENYGKEL